MSRSKESFNKKEVRNKKEKKRIEKEKKRLARKDIEKKGSLDDMIAYVDKNGMITTTPPDPNKVNTIKIEDIEVSIPRRDDSEKPDIIRTGIVTYFNELKGYGFIRNSETNENVFVHVNNLLEDIEEGNIVNFEVEKGKRGLAATQVKLSK